MLYSVVYGSNVSIVIVEDPNFAVDIVVDVVELAGTLTVIDSVILLKQYVIYLTLEELICTMPVNLLQL